MMALADMKTYEMPSESKQCPQSKNATLNQPRQAITEQPNKTTKPKPKPKKQKLNN
jgi:hypothetical protein